jgi:aminobenzoyl-glutamate transport protein
MAAAFAGVSGGFSANLVLTSLDPLLSGISTEAARLIDPAYTVQPDANYFFMLVSVIVLTTVGTLVTARVVEPRLGQWQPGEGTVTMPDAHAMAAPTPQEMRGLRAAGVTFLLTAIGIALLVVPGNPATAYFAARPGGWSRSTAAWCRC